VATSAIGCLLFLAWIQTRSLTLKHVKMNFHILGDAMVVHRRNDQKVVFHVHVKAQCEWDELVIVAQHTITKTNFGQVNFRAIIVGVGS